MSSVQAATQDTVDWPNSALHAHGRWFVLHTRSRQEKALGRDLTAMHVPCYLPMIDTVRYYGRRKARARLPLFPNYVFLRGSIDQAYQADRTRRVAGIIKVANQDRLDRELRNIHQVLLADGQLQPSARLQRGMWVQVKAGPFKGVQGQIEQHTRTDRLILQVQTLGQASSLEIDTGLLEPIDPFPED